MAKIKICGLYRDEDIGYVNEAKPDFAGFIINFPRSHRNLPIDKVDLVVNTDVLEHIPDDKKAMSELYRVLKPAVGVALLTVPIKDSLFTTLENPEYNTPELRTKYYGQSDHVRYYGLDYPDRLRAAKFSVDEITLDRILNDDVRIGKSRFIVKRNVKKRNDRAFLTEEATRVDKDSVGKPLFRNTRIIKNTVIFFSKNAGRCLTDPRRNII